MVNRNRFSKSPSLAALYNPRLHCVRKSSKAGNFCAVFDARRRIARKDIRVPRVAKPAFQAATRIDYGTTQTKCFIGGVGNFCVTVLKLYLSHLVFKLYLVRVMLYELSR